MNDKRSRSDSLFGVVAAMAVIWHVFGATIVALENPHFSLPKKIAFCVSAILISICLLFTGTGSKKWGCAILFFVQAIFLLGAMWLR